MDQDMRELIDSVESSVRHQLSYSTSHTRYATVLVGGQDILEIFAAFRLEIIKAGGRNA